MSNLRQIAMATVMYTSANKGVFPGQGGGALMPHNWIQWKNEPPDNWDINDSTFVQYLATGEALKRIYRCPSDDFLARPVASSSVTPYRYSYSMNQMLTNPNQSSYKVAPYNLPTLKFVRISQVRSASSKILLVDETDQTIDDGVWKPFLILDATANPPTFQGTTNPNQIADRHERRKDKTDLQGHGNVAFVDGHAAIIDRMEAGKQEYHDPFR